MKKALIVLAFIAPFLLSAEEPKANQTTKKYTGEALKIQEIIENLFDASKKVNKPKETKDKERARIESSMDWDRISKDCMGTQWAKQSPANREQFKKLLKDVMVKTAYSRMDTFWNNTTYQFASIDVKGSQAEVLTKFKVDEDTFDLQYYLNKKGNSWLVYDIAYENIRYSHNISEQITGFLKGSNFAALADKLKKRREELEKDSDSATTLEAKNKKPNS
jgi:ABC-type transporter MlaC component